MPALSLLPFLAQASPAFTAGQLQRDLLAIAVAVVLFCFAAVALVLFFFRRKSRELTLVYFGMFSILYGLRLLLYLQTTRFSFGLTSPFWEYLRWLITCTIILPFELFLYQISGTRLKVFFRWLITIQAALSVLGVVLGAVGTPLDKLYTANSISVLATLFTLPVFLLFTREASLDQPWTKEIRVFVAGLSVWLAFILYANLVSLQVFKGRDVEFLGFLFFVGSLGYITVSRSFAKEELLLTLNKELEIARQIQSSTLPRNVPQLTGLEIAARYLPMSAVAGDFYDFLVLDQQRVGVLVADVTGHGVPAALIASMLKVALAGQADHAEDPARLLAGLNRALCGRFEEHFVTAVYVFTDLAKGILRYAGAGHPPLLVASSSHGGVRAVQENGLMLGLFPEASYASAEISVRPGDRCLLYTDGLFEAANVSQEEFGKERLSRFLLTHHHLPAPILANALLEEISRWAGHSTGRRQDDDITIVVLDFPVPGREELSRAEAG